MTSSIQNKPALGQENIKDILSSIDALLYAESIVHFNKNAKQNDLSIYPLAVQKCLARTHNFLLYKEQFETLYVLAGGENENALRFRRDWNMKKPKTRKEADVQLRIGDFTLLEIVEALCYDQENFFVVGEPYQNIIEKLDQAHALNAKDSSAKYFHGLAYITYDGDVSSEKTEGFAESTRSAICLTALNENELWVSFQIEREGQLLPFNYNLLGEHALQEDLYFLNPQFLAIQDQAQFMFSSTIAWDIEGECEHFSFAVRYFGELPKYVRVEEVY